MAHRGADEIRREIAEERRRLDETREALRAELRSLVPILVLGGVAVGVLAARKGLKAGIGTIRMLS